MVNNESLIDNGEWVASFTIINSPFTIRKRAHTPTQNDHLKATLTFTDLCTAQ